MYIYFDNAATTRPCDEAIKGFLEGTEYYANPSSTHKMGIMANNLLQESRQQIANVVNCKSEEIIFTSGATEANNLAIIGIALANKRKGNKIITTSIEHPSVSKSIEFLKTQGFVIDIISKKKSEKQFNTNDFIDAVDDNTILVCAMNVNNENGISLDIDTIAQAVKNKNKNIYFHSDLVQSFLKKHINLKKMMIDTASFSGHKVWAPKGIGFLYLKEGTNIYTQSYGGNQEFAKRAGTESIPNIVALANVVKHHSPKIDKNLYHYNKLKTHLIKGLSLLDSVKVLSDDNCVPYIISIAVYGIKSEILLNFLQSHDIFVSSGSACSKGKVSYVLQELSVDKLSAQETIRVSFSPDNTLEEIDCFLKILNIGLKTIIRYR